MKLLRAMHQFSAILVSLLAVVIIGAGSLSLYRAELDQWSEPYLRTLPPWPNVVGPEQSALDQQADSQIALRHAQRFLQQHAATAQQWYIELPDRRKPYLILHWQDPQGLWRQWLDPQSGLALGPEVLSKYGDQSHSLGGWFFQLHYTLLDVAGRFSRELAAAAALLLLWTALSGFKILLSRWHWLWPRPPASINAALHSAEKVNTQVIKARFWHLWSALAALPFLLWFCSSALVTMLWQLNPAPLNQLYQQSGEFYQAVFGTAPVATAATDLQPGETAAVLDLAQLLQQHQAELGWPVAKIQLQQPATGQGLLKFTQAASSQISNDLATAWYSADGRLLSAAGQLATVEGQLHNAAGQILSANAPVQSNVDATTPQASGVMQLRSTWYGLHQALFAGPGLRAWLALLGLCSLLMIGAGLRQWRLRHLQQAGFGHWLCWSLLPGLPLSFCALILLQAAVLPIAAPTAVSGAMVRVSQATDIISSVLIQTGVTQTALPLTQQWLVCWLIIAMLGVAWLRWTARSD